MKIKSRAQYGQDLWVEEMTNAKRNGFFIELGARDGKKTSNTFYLEKKLNWSGILVECCPYNIEKLKKIDRTNSEIDTRAIFSENNKKIKFNTSKSSGIGSLIHKEQFREEVEVTTVTLDVLLKEHNAPKQINYISIDVEGVEEDVLLAFNWQYDIQLWTIENGNFDPTRRERIRKLMFDKNYMLVKNHKGDDIDDWFYKKN